MLKKKKPVNALDGPGQGSDRSPVDYATGEWEKTEIDGQEDEEEVKKEEDQKPK